VESWWGPIILEGNVEQTGGFKELEFDPSECTETDRAVQALRCISLDLHAAIIEMYIRGGTGEQKAKALHCTRQTLYNRLDRAYGELLGLFNDQAAGITLRTSADQA
jgi:DNA-directed RNA polymerase specialized sigma24 family protein